MGGWAEFAAAFGVFFLSHSLPVRPRVKGRLVAFLGTRGFTLAYSGVSLAVLSWLIAAAGRAPYVELWPWAPWQTLVPVVAMAVACLIVALAVGRPNPFSFGGARNATFEPARPGLVRWMRHPLLVALALWAGAHVVPNGDLAHVLLFSTLGLFAVAGMPLIDRRKQRELGADWHGLKARTLAIPLLAMPALSAETGARLAAAAGLYVALLSLHPVLFAVNPLPRLWLTG